MDQQEQQQTGGQRTSTTGDGRQGRPAGTGEDGRVENLGQVVDEWLGVGDDIIRRSLSGNSLRFLRAGRQETGE